MSDFKEPAKKHRAEWAKPCLELYQELTGENDEEMPTVIADFLTDLMHLCDAHGIDFEDALDTARMHHDAEVEEEAL